MGRKGSKSLLRRRQPLPPSLSPQSPQSPPTQQQSGSPAERMFHGSPVDIVATDSCSSKQPMVAKAAVKRAHQAATEPAALAKLSRPEPTGRNGSYRGDQATIQMAPNIYWNIGESDEDELYCERDAFAGRVIKKLKQPRNRPLPGEEDGDATQHYVVDATSKSAAAEQLSPQSPPAAETEPVQVRKLHIDLPNSKLYLISPLATRSLPHSVNCSRAGNAACDKLYLLMQQQHKQGPANGSAVSAGGVENPGSTRLTLIRSKNTCDCRSFRENLHKILPGIVDRITRGTKTPQATPPQQQTNPEDLCTAEHQKQKNNGFASGRIPSNGLSQLAEAAAASKAQQEITCGATPVIVSNAGYLAKKLASLGGGAAAAGIEADKQANSSPAVSEEKAVLNGAVPSSGGSKENILGFLDYPAQSLKHAMVTVLLKDGDRSIDKVLPLSSDLTFLISLLPYMERLPTARKDVIKETIKTLLLCQLRYN